MIVFCQLVLAEWILCGRPFGGCAILYRSSLLSFVSCHDSPSKRFCSVTYVCVYLPSNDGSFNCHNDFLITLRELEGFIDQHTSDHLLIVGTLMLISQKTVHVLVCVICGILCRTLI